MGPERDGHFCQLPIIPEDVLRKHRVLEKHDTRFRACARLLQAMWRADQDLPIGTHAGPHGQRRIGSLLGTSAAAAGRNFLSPEIAHLVRREVTYQESGALIDRGRLFGNLLSSMPLAFNLFAPLHLNRELAANVVRGLIPDIDLARVLHVRFEHSPGRLHEELTGDRTALDVAVVYERADGERGLLAIEQKYSEGGSDGSPELSSRYDDLARSSEIYKNPMSAVLRTGSCRQLFREHLLTFAARYRGDYAEARFILVAPRHNRPMQHAATLYASYLAEPAPDAVPFLSLELEQVVEAIGWAGELGYAQALYDRYLNWWKIDAVVEQALRSKTTDWAVAAPSLPAPVALVSKAA